MADVVSVEVRSRMMAGIRGKNTKPELIIRRGLHARAFRYVLHDKRLPGKPDLVFPKYRAAIFVHGCFWHGHDCHLFRWPTTRTDFWRKKINRNREVDRKALVALKEAGWRCCIIWECSLKGRGAIPIHSLLDRCSSWLRSNRPSTELRGTPKR
ncbi:very short patch repair endonuclease [Bradyrhizobium sp. 156]|uniref:very short patch repair endonuclease n=2 Tax=Bradyrhizobium TaxID=374 RepID=UPI0020660DC9|nr:DNA mismatch endonuclease Vsr [Bradyrhizobium sp. 156]MCK1503278.1 DNA mismatch endonuclease Vsr [Bradyrhizobium sp. 188]MCK1565415.1 DNA mismatch endonuclease Vsr [Bradyrhizobium sp. 173]MCK1676206.1 DNA mismatch endonuclease Vsr [Bradyrhizobium sp. 150]UPJ27590.1 DNA mismatch endonuclease Vsr [Bradyrhizobium sp. CW1]UPJ80564.1 DNA mismatch endonuclease Vsr [Bradyrhizobium sp. 184]UPJ88357.1 DNA mismatch endonuclease Vsr [Bradyrhizobium sp. 183]UPJ96076.1 DNA mismatch endonuclease Vsr [B